MENFEDKKGKVSWKVFIWALGIILILFGMVFSQINSVTNTVQASNKDTTDIKVQLSQIQTDLQWIKQNISLEASSLKPVK